MTDNFSSTYLRNIALRSFFLESANIGEQEYSNLSEEFKIDTVKQIAIQILSEIGEKSKNIDTTEIDKSRGNIKNLQSLEIIQAGTQKLVELSNTEEGTGDLKEALEIIVNTIQNLSRFAPQYMEAYRSKKTLMILKYQSIVMAVISAISYLISDCVEASPSGDVQLKKNYQISDITPLNWLKKYSSSISDIVNESIAVNNIRKYFNEYNAEQLSTIYEASNIISLLNTGINNINDMLKGNTKLSGVFYKFASVIMLILSLRDIFYTIYAYKTPIKDFVNNIKGFVDLGKSSLGQVANFLGFNRKASQTAKSADSRVESEINSENKQIVNTAQQDYNDSMPIQDTPSYTPDETLDPAPLERADNTSTPTLDIPSDIISF